MKILWMSLLLMLGASLNLEAKDIPDALADWVDWVKYEQSYRNCPYFNGQNQGNKNHHVCAWPQQLQMDVNAQGAQFKVTWEVLDDSWIPLPGDSTTWPLAVSSNQQALTVQPFQNQPRVLLSAGTHEITGQFNWSSRPEAISLPKEMADVRLKLEGKEIRFPVIQNNNLWLGEAVDEEKVEANSVDIEVNRLIIDGHPMTVFVVLDLQVSGVARNEKLGRIGSLDYQITEVDGDLNAYVDQSGDLWAQLKPGYNEIRVNMIIKGWPNKLSFEPVGEHWPRQEIWAYQDNKNIRLTQIEGVTAINPEQSASRWDQVPNYLLNAGDVFTINEQKRGTLNQSESLTMTREAWLSFTGDVYRTQDHIVGDKFGSWRLNADADLKLLSATNQNQEPLLITESVSAQQGLELRTPNVSLHIDGEMGSAFQNKISGWDISFETIKTQLYLPHGYLALATHNVDRSQNVWLEQWRLWDIFIIMLITVLSFKVVGIKSAVFALVTLVLGYHDLNMPLYSWANLILALALLAWIPQGRWLRFFQSYAIISVLSLVILLLPHLVNQARWSIHPQLENQRLSSTSPIKYSAVKKEARSNQIYQQTYNVQNAVPSADLYSGDMVEESSNITVTGSRIKRADVINKYQADAVLQAGKGTPQWRYNPVVLEWYGPVTAAQNYQLILVSPWMRVIWRLLLIVAAVLWLLTITQHMQQLFKQKTTQTASATTSLILLVGLCLIQPVAAESFPSEAMLKELKSRIYPGSDCERSCATIEQANVSVTDNQLTIQLTYHTLDYVGVPIPSSQDWQLTSVQINGQNTPSRLQHNRQQWIALEKGIHEVILRGRLANRNNISLQFAIKPGHITAQSAQWQFAGINGSVLSGNTLQLIATKPNNSDELEASKTTEIAPFVKLERSITFDDQWYVTNYVTRMAPKHGALNVVIPLIDNEFPVEKLQQNEQGDVLINLAPGDSYFSWRSRLERLPQFTITAADDPQYLEEWHVVSSPQWHVNIKGIPLVAAAELADDYDDYFVHVYLPRPNETIQIDVSRPTAVAGNSLAIDDIKNTYSMGKRTTKTVTHINYTATQGGRFAVNLDPEALVKKVTFDGVESNLANENGVVSVSYLPGKHNVVIEWQVNQSFDLTSLTPSITLDADYSNLSQTITVPRDRWLLWGHSAGTGPAFLYWGELLVFIILAFFLARIKYSPLKIWQWLLLGWAFGTFSWMAFAVVAVWLFFVGWKHQFSGFASKSKNILLQWFTLIFTLVALIVFISAVAYGLLSYPDMGVAGRMASATQLHWYVDAGSQSLPQITILSVHLWWYKLLILLWSIWISFAVLAWLKQVLESLQQGLWWPAGKKKTATNKNQSEN